MAAAHLNGFPLSGGRQHLRWGFCQLTSCSCSSLAPLPISYLHLALGSVAPPCRGTLSDRPVLLPSTRPKWWGLPSLCRGEYTEGLMLGTTSLKFP